MHIRAPILKKILVSILLLVMAAATAFGAYHYFEATKERQEVWSRVVSRFERCSLGGARVAMGSYESPSLFEDLPVSAVDGGSQLELLLTDGYRSGRIRDLTDVWLSPSEPYSVSHLKGDQPDSVNLMQQCEAQIAKGNLAPWIEVGLYYLDIGHPNAVQWLTRAGEAGAPDAYVLLGWAAELGRISGVKDEKSAVIYFAKGAHMGSARGMMELAWRVLPVDTEKALMLIEQAAQAGSRHAMFALQDGTGPLGGGRFANPRKRYFWSLYLDYLHTKETQGSADAFLDAGEEERARGRIPEMPTEYEWLGMRVKPWAGKAFEYRVNTVEKPRTVVKDDAEWVKKSIEDLEQRLDPETRIFVQGRVKQWIASRDVSAKETPPTPSLPQAGRDAATAKLKPWRAIDLPICKAGQSRQERAGSDLFKDFKAYVWTVIAINKTSNATMQGSAVAVAPTLLATNCHVVAKGGDIEIHQDSIKTSATVLAADTDRDMCLLQTEHKMRHAPNALALKDVDVGSTAYALGSPQGLTMTFSNGIVSGIRNNKGKDYIQTTAAISPGSSGGALIDGRGNLLGITTFYLQGGQSMNFAIPIRDFCPK